MLRHRRLGGCRFASCGAGDQPRSGLRAAWAWPRAGQGLRASASAGALRRVVRVSWAGRGADGVDDVPGSLDGHDQVTLCGLIG
jgi:hypothetical protein